MTIVLQVAWIKADSKAILAIHDHVITNKRKIKVTRNDESTYVLTIEEVSQKDEGFYMCQVNSEPMLHQVKQFFLTLEITNDIFFNNLQLECKNLNTSQKICLFPDIISSSYITSYYF